MTIRKNRLLLAPVFAFCTRLFFIFVKKEKKKKDLNLDSNQNTWKEIKL